MSYLHFLPSLVFAVWSAWRLFILLSLISRIESAKDWVRVKAKVLDSRLLDSGASRKIGGKHTRAIFYAIYNKDEIEFGTRTISLYRKETRSDRAKVSRISVGEEVDVYINPNKPHESSLTKPGAHGYLFEWALLLIGMSITGLSFYFAGVYYG